MEIIKNILKGTAIGAANVIPGVSGGTIAFVFGIYDKLTEAIGEFLTASKEEKIDFAKFLIQIGVGAVIGILFFAKLIEVLYQNSAESTNMFFTGLIVASVPIIYQEEKENLNKKSFLYFVIGFIVVLIFGYLSGNSGEKSSIININRELSALYSLKIFICGLLAAGTMVVPGVSGSLLLLLLGEYYNVLGFINNRNLVAIAIIGVGAICGIVIFARVIDYFLKKKRTITMFFILGLVTASAVEVFPGITLTGTNIIFDLLTFVLGFGLVMLVKKLDRREAGGKQ